MKKKLTAIALVVALLAVAVIGGTLAYFTDTTETAENTFTVGNVKIELTEPNWEGSGSVDAPEVYPGEKLAKDPTVENIGANPCFVRVSVTGLDCLAPAGEITIEGLSADWVKEGDYYYYTKVLAAGAKTPALFNGIRMPADLENGDGKTEFSVDVFAQAVQAQGAKPSFSAVQNMTVAEIAAWFTTCGL